MFMRNESSMRGAPTAELPESEAAPKRSSHAPALITRMRFQYPLGLALCLLAPLVAQVLLLETPSAPNVVNTAIGVMAAVTIGYYAFRRIAAYPTLWPPAASVTPVFSISFLLIVAWFFLLRIEYSRFQFVFGYVLVVAWFMGLSLATSRLSRPRFALVPLGDAPTIRGLAKADWLEFEAPGPLPQGVSGVVVDTKADFGAGWEACLAASALAGTPIYDFRAVREAMTGRLEVLSFADNVLAAHDPNGA